MLSNDELTNGMPFVLKLWDAAGVATEWHETLSGDLARRWYDIYRRSDWRHCGAKLPACSATAWRRRPRGTRDTTASGAS
jgi:hypothetical protein